MNTQNEPPQDLKEFRDRLIWARHAVGLTQIEVADAAGLSRATYNRLEQGKNKTTGRAVQIAKKLQVNPDWLVTGEGFPFARPLQIAKLDIDNNSLLLDNHPPPHKKWTEVIADREHGLSLFSYTLEGDAMQGGKQNDIPHGAMVDVDPDQAGKPGTVQLAEIGGFPAIGVLQQMGPKFYLRPNNSAYPTAEVELTNLIGAVVGYKVTF